jgi:hypothetical protein
VILTDRHIGDHIDFQWKLLGSIGFDPAYLVFYVPHLTRGNIIPDLNAVPLDQIQFGFGDLAPPDGPWGFTIAQTTLTNDACLGFDSETPKIVKFSSPWLSVPLAGTNTLTVIISPTNVVTQVIFDTSIPSVVSVSPAQATSATQVVQVVSSGTSTNVNPILHVKGYGAQNTYTTTCASVAIDVLPKATSVTVAVYRVTASIPTNSPTPANVPTQTDLKSYLDEIYGKQANVFMTVLPVTNIVVNYDLNANGLLDVDTSTDILFAEARAITNAAYRAGALNVYYVKAITNVTTTKIIVGITHRGSKTTYIQDAHADSNVHVAAHEIGHSLGNLDDIDGSKGFPGTPERLMWEAALTNNPCRLIQKEWDQINQRARGL